MVSRTQKHNDVPLNGKGRALLVGKGYCGHCGSKLILTTSGKNIQRADGTFRQKVALRYQCHYKVRHPQLCDGQTGYGVVKLDEIVTQAMHQLFGQIKTIPEDEVIQAQLNRKQKECEAFLARSRELFAEQDKELNDYRSEVLRVIRGQSALNMDLLNELIQEAEAKREQAQNDVSRWSQELCNQKKTAETLHNTYSRIISWSEMFDHCNMDQKKMIAAQMIDRVRVWENYRIEIDFNASVEPILNY